MLLQNIFQPKIIMIRFMLHLFKLFIIILQKAGGQMYCLTCDLTWSDLFANLKTPASLFVCASMHNLQHIFPQIIKKNQYRFREKRGHSANCIKKIYLTEHLGLKAHFLSVYRVDQQCCPGRNHCGGSPDFLAKSLVIPTKYTKFKLITHKFKLEFCIYGWNYQ